MICRIYAEKTTKNSVGCVQIGRAEFIKIFPERFEFERNLIRERTQAGLAAARARGRKGGRKPALDAKQVREIKALLRDPDIQVADVAKRYGVSRATIYKHVGAVRPERGASPMI